MQLVAFGGAARGPRGDPRWQLGYSEPRRTRTRCSQKTKRAATLGSGPSGGARRSRHDDQRRSAPPKRVLAQADASEAVKWPSEQIWRASERAGSSARLRGCVRVGANGGERVWAVGEQAQARPSGDLVMRPKKLSFKIRARVSLSSRTSNRSSMQSIQFAGSTLGLTCTRHARRPHASVVGARVCLGSFCRQSRAFIVPFPPTLLWAKLKNSV